MTRSDTCPCTSDTILKQQKPRWKTGRFGLQAAEFCQLLCCFTGAVVGGLRQVSLRRSNNKMFMKVQLPPDLESTVQNFDSPQQQTQTRQAEEDVKNSTELFG